GIVRRHRDSWSGVGHVAVRMHHQGFDLQLTQYDERGWRATFYMTGMERTVQRARWTEPLLQRVHRFVVRLVQILIGVTEALLGRVPRRCARLLHLGELLSGLVALGFERLDLFLVRSLAVAGGLRGLSLQLFYLRVHVTQEFLA